MKFSFIAKQGGIWPVAWMCVMGSTVRTASAQRRKHGAANSSGSVPNSCDGAAAFNSSLGALCISADEKHERSRRHRIRIARLELPTAAVEAIRQ